MDGTILGQGTFISSGTLVPAVAVTSIPGNPVYLQIPSNADWMYVKNYTAYGRAGSNPQAAATVASGLTYYWQRGMPIGSALVEYYANGGQAVNGDLLASGGFTLYDPSGQSGSYALQPLGPAIATTASTNATRPVVSTGNTAGLVVGSVVRLSNTAQSDVNGIDFVVGAVTANTNFTLMTATNALATAPGAIGGAGFYRVVNFNALFYPRKRIVTNITQAANAQVSTSIAHGLTPGQEVRFYIPQVSGMTQLSYDYVGNINSSAIILTVVDDYNFTININTTNYTAFTFPTIAQQPSSFPEVVPFGEDTATALSTNAAQVPSIGGVQIYNTNTGILADSTVNTGYLGMILGAGGPGTITGANILGGPSGTIYNTGTGGTNITTFDVMYWVAGKSTYGGL